MSELIHTMSRALEDANGSRYRVHVRGREVAGGLWEGWLEFEPLAGPPSRVTGRETTQPNGEDLRYWATGLEPAYLEGAFERAR